MAVFLVSYDAHVVRNYDRLYKAMAEHGAVRILESLWGLEADNTAVEIRDWIKDSLDDDDSIFVIMLKPKHGWGGRKLKDQAGEWLRDNV